MTGDGLAILVPVLERPHRVRPLMRSIAAATPGARVMFISDPHDQAEQDAVAATGGDLLVHGGCYAEKINAAVAATEEPLLFFGADDLDFRPGWLTAAADMIDGQVGVVGTNDLCNPRVMAGQHATHSLVTRAYTELGTIDDPSRVLHEGYLHEFVDDEFVQTAMHRGAFAYAPDAVVEHLHPMAGKAPMDHLYAGQRARMRVGRRVFQERVALWT